MFRNSAHIYDLIYEAEGKDYASEAQAIREQVEARRPAAASLLDVACGTGGHLRYLAQWYDVGGVDLDAGMLSEARIAFPDVPFVEGDMQTFDFARSFDVITCLFSSIGYMATVDELNTAVQNMARHLNPGGVLLVDGWVRPDVWVDGSVSAVAVRRDAIAVARAGRSWRDHEHTYLELHHLVATPDGIEHVVDEHRLTLFTEAEYETAFRDAGLAVERIDSPMPGRDRYIGVKP
jgi:SAM-dependent methyltransferase